MIYIRLESDGKRLAKEINEFLKETKNEIISTEHTNTIVIDDGSDVATIINAQNSVIRRYNTDPLKADLTIGKLIPVELGKEGVKKKRWVLFRVVNVDPDTGLVWMLCTQPTTTSTSNYADSIHWEAEFKLGLFKYRATRDAGNYIVLPTKKDIVSISPELANIDEYYWLSDEEYEDEDIHEIAYNFEDMYHNRDPKVKTPARKVSKYAVDQFGELEEISVEDKGTKYAVAPMIKFSLEYYDEATNLTDTLSKEPEEE